MTHRILSHLRRFWKGTEASVSAEAVLVLPLVLWAYLGTYTYYDIFGTITRNMKATYTLADLLSRQVDTVTGTDLNGMDRLYAYLNHNPSGVWIRVTTISWQSDASSADGGYYYPMMTYATDGTKQLTDKGLSEDDLQAYKSRLPAISEGDTLIMVETHMTYKPLFKIVGIQQQNFTQTVITRPRISPQVDIDPTS